MYGAFKFLIIAYESSLRLISYGNTPGIRLQLIYGCCMRCERNLHDIGEFTNMFLGEDIKTSNLSMKVNILKIQGHFFTRIS